MALLVKRSFSAKTKDGKKTYITRMHESKLTELLTSQQIDDFKKSGSLVETKVNEKTPVAEPVVNTRSRNKEADQ